MPASSSNHGSSPRVGNNNTNSRSTTHHRDTESIRAHRDSPPPADSSASQRSATNGNGIDRNHGSSGNDFAHMGSHLKNK
ncbi:hypothetical protein AB5N19_07800 [Seiridium cardinale]|uniref:Uncharacterized protein n=1 Tax=Seiridium cardinale TaxID=138064 RepID=A0ABR2Y2E7_9PEZI